MRPFIQAAWTVTALLVGVLIAPMLSPAAAQTVSLHHHNAEIWSLEQQVRGSMDGAESGILKLNEETVSFDADGGTFAVDVRISGTETTLVACTEDESVCSDPVTWTLGYTPRPEVLLSPEVTGHEIRLIAHVLDNPLGSELTFDWSEDASNPAVLGLNADTDTTATVMAAGAPDGEYYFNVDVSDADGQVRRARTFVTVDGDIVEPFDIASDHASWIDSATLYELAPWYFSRGCSNKFACIEDKLEEIADLGVTAIWLQPVYPTMGGGQAYDVLDYFDVWDELGDKDGLRSLIATARSLGLKVMFDFVPNHTSIDHPYALDAIEHGEESAYWNFYMREGDGAPYGNNYRLKTVGAMTFVYYFWEDLVTFNYADEQARTYVIEASRYWIEEFDIDGYRLDAVWAPHARNPEFMHEWRRAMKRVKPEILLLAEAKAAGSTAHPDGFPSIFENFDAAYDWTDLGWCISEWSWARPNQCSYFPTAYGYSGPKETIFNYGLDRFRADQLRSAITNDGRGYVDEARVLHFLENNDTPRFIAHHTVDQTRMAAALVFALPGIPMLYYGQESGLRPNWPTIATTRTIRSYDVNSLWPYYQHLAELRSGLPALHSDSFEEVVLANEEPEGQVFAWRRWAEGSNLVAAVNLGAADAQVTLSVPEDRMTFDFDASGGIHLTDLLSGDHFSTSRDELGELTIDLAGHQAAVYALADSVMAIQVSDERVSEVPPIEFRLGANYPNPFARSTTVPVSLPEPGSIRYELFDLLGRRVLEGQTDRRARGNAEFSLDGSSLPSGVYLLRVRSGSSSATRRVTVIR